MRGAAAAAPSLNAASLEAVLRLLDDDRDRAGERYEVMRRKLTKFFECHGCTEPDGLADETIDRVGRRLAEGEQIRSGDAGAYFHGVARNVLRESWRDSRRLAPLSPRQAAPPEPAPDALSELRLRCIDACLEALPSGERDLIMWYYQSGESVHIRSRKRLAGALGIGMNALRIRVHRIRARLEACVRHRLAGLAEIESPRGARESEDDTAR